MKNYNQVIHGDCLDVMSGIESDIFDTTFVDPPFNLDKDYLTYEDALEDEEYLDWCDKWIGEIIRITKPSGSIFIHNIPKWLCICNCFLKNYDVSFKHWIAWDAPTAPMGKSLQPGHYGILYYVKNEKDDAGDFVDNSKIYELRMPHKRCRDKRGCNLLLRDYGGKKHTIHPFGPLVSDVWTDIFRCKHNKYKDKHPCQLPIHLLERIVLLSTDEGDTIFDCFMGTGTTALAAKRLGRNYFGIELCQQYVDIANGKLEKETIPSCFDEIWFSCFRKMMYTVRNCDIWDSKKKEYKEQFRNMFENWPENDEECVSMNTQSLRYTKDLRNYLKELSVPYKEK